MFMAYIKNINLFLLCFSNLIPFCSLKVVMTIIRNISIILISIMLLSGDLTVFPLYAHFQASELLSEVESVEERTIEEYVTRVRRVKFERSASIPRISRVLAFQANFISPTTEASLVSTPRFIRYCALLN